MLVLANGAPKSGSTWLFEILRNFQGFEPVPMSYRHADHNLAWLDTAKLRIFLESGDYRTGKFISKAHIYDETQRDLLLSFDEVYVCDISRDLRDAIVSHYYHVNRERQLSWSFPNYYWWLGRYKALQIEQYHDIWRVPSPRVYKASYEDLKQNFSASVSKLAAFFNMTLSSSEIEDIARKTSLETLQKRTGQDDLPPEKRFFRKGAVGDWQAHFNERTLRDIERIMRGERSPADQVGYALLFELRPKLAAYYRRLRSNH